MKKIAFMALLGLVPPALAEDQVVVSNATTPVVVEEEASTVGQHGFYYALGLLFCNSGERYDFYDINNSPRDTEANRFGTHLGATLALGYQFMPQSQPYCVGLEIGSDFAPRQEEIHSDKIGTHTARGDDLYDLTTTRNGFRPFAALRVGYVNYDHKFMLYLKAGMSYADSKSRKETYRLSGGDYELFANEQIKCSCWTPIVALGIEKSFTNNFTLRGEAEYKFTRTKDDSWNRNDGTRVGAKLIQKGTFNIRVLFCHNIRLGQ